MENISRDIIQKAFEKAAGEVPVTNGKFVLVEEPYYPRALEFIRNYYTKFEPISRALGLVWNQEQEDFWLGALKDNLTPMLINDKSGEVMAIRVIHVVRRGTTMDESSIKDKQFRRFVFYCNVGDAKADFFGHFDVDEAFHFLAMAVNDKYQRQGLAGKIFKVAANMIRYIGHVPTYIKGEASSNYSKKIYAKHGFKELFQNPFDSYKIDGKCVICNTGEHTSMNFYGLKIA